MTGAKRSANVLHSYSAKEYTRDTIKENGSASVSAKEYGTASNSIPFAGGLSAASRGSPGLLYTQPQLQQPNNSYELMGVGMSKKSRQSVLIPSASALAASMPAMTGPRSSLWR